jgi:hypothetical protein
MLIDKLINTGNYVPLNWDIVKSIGLNETILLARLCSMYDYFQHTKQLESGGWFFARVTDIENDTTFTKYQQQILLDSLAEYGLIEKKLSGMPRKRYVRFTKNTYNQMESILSMASKKLDDGMAKNLPYGTQEICPHTISNRLHQNTISNLLEDKIIINDNHPTTTFLATQSPSNKITKEQSDRIARELSDRITRELSDLQTMTDEKLNSKQLLNGENSIEFKKAAIEYANKFKKSVKDKIKVTNQIYNSWITVFLDLLRLDNRKVDEIFAVTKWARQNDFWRANFLSAVKLRKTNKEGIMYYDVFRTAMQSEQHRRRDNSNDMVM